MRGGAYLRCVEDEMRNDREYIRTYSGLKCWPVDPRPEDIAIEDIAHALSLLCRFTGHVREFYSVGDHCLRVSELCSTENQLWGLMHDASEAYLVDLARPIKRNEEFGAIYKKIETNLMRCICEKFGFSKEEPAEVKEMDNKLLRTEQRDLMPVSNDGPLEDNDRWQDGVKPLSYKIVPRPPQEVEQMFLTRFNQLISQPKNSIQESYQSTKVS